MNQFRDQSAKQTYLMPLLCFTQAATKLLDEMCHLTAQSLATMDTSEHFKLLKLMGEGSYGKVMLAVHRKRGEQITKHDFLKNGNKRYS